MNLTSKIRRTVFMGGDLGDVEVDFEIHIDRMNGESNAAIVAVAEGVSGFLVLRDHPLDPAIVALREANLGYLAAVKNGEFDALATFAARNDVGLEAEFPTEVPALIALDTRPLDEWLGEVIAEPFFDEDAEADAELERREQLSAIAWE